MHGEVFMTSFMDCHSVIDDVNTILENKNLIKSFKRVNIMSLIIYDSIWITHTK